jgi:hypothetical protein
MFTSKPTLRTEEDKHLHFSLGESDAKRGNRNITCPLNGLVNIEIIKALIFLNQSVPSILSFIFVEIR